MDVRFTTRPASLARSKPIACRVSMKVPTKLVSSTRRIVSAGVSAIGTSTSGDQRCWLPAYRGGQIVHELRGERDPRLRTFRC